METEIKFQVPPGRRDAVRRAVETATARRVRLQAAYADTADRRLAAAGLALRLRHEGRDWVQTLKGRGDGLMQRVEHEVRLPRRRGEPVLDPARHAGSPAGDLLARILARRPDDRAGDPDADGSQSADGADDAAALRTIYRTDVQRTHRLVRHRGAVVEIAHDRGRIVAGSRSVPVDEIEFELIRGDPAALVDLAARWAHRHGLWWDVRTKSERGHRLADGVDAVPAVKSELPVPYAASASTGAAFAAIVEATLRHALPNAAEIASGADDASHVHQLRVALRRLRTALHLFGGWSADPAEAEALEAAWRDPFGQLGAARDADVMAQAFAPALDAAGAPPFDWPGAVAAPPPGDVVRGAGFNALLLRTLSLAVRGTAATGGAGDAAAASGAVQGPLADVAAEPLDHGWRRLQRDARRWDDAGPDDRHRARKRLKRLRYALEFLLPVLRTKSARRLRKAMSKALDAMGLLNDLRTAEAALREQAAVDPRAWFGAGWAAGRSDAAQRRAGDALRALAKTRRKALPWR